MVLINYVILFGSYTNTKFVFNHGPRLCWNSAGIDFIFIVIIITHVILCDDLVDFNLFLGVVVINHIYNNLTNFDFFIFLLLVMIVYHAILCDNLTNFDLFLSWQL